MSTGREKSIFLTALECPTAAERAAYLAEACKGDPLLERAVEELLRIHQRSTSTIDLLKEGSDPRERLLRQLDAAASVLGFRLSAAPAGRDAPPDRSGEVIDHYRLLEKIGEGGFGEVYVAAQEEPVRRRVALKLLKPGMGSRDVIARFEAERQALALMDHPNIAKVFDAGTSAAGEPYFVMELVRGVPITDFCEAQELAVDERLELFVNVCRAVQHAHQKGVIHRDLKPSNVLVTLHDTIPVVKVIDFGVAKAIEEPLTEKTIYTRFAQMIGTPMYMSPEQAEMNALDVDTRSDIYALGVLLYELLTGTTPFDRERMKTATFDELRRIIRTEEPPRPSVRLSTLERAGGVNSSPQRRIDTRSLSGMLRGDLDWIVMKALEKDRRRRYDTAAELARDVERHLDEEPVLARAPSFWYRASKFARRNKVVFMAASLVLVALIAGTSVSTWQAIRATRAQEEAEILREEATEFADRLKRANVLLDSARANADERRWGLAYLQYTEAAELQPNHYVTWSGRGSLYVRVGAFRAAARDFARALELGAKANNPGWWGVPQLCMYAGDENAYELACANLDDQLERDDDVLGVTSAIRSLSMRERSPEEARRLVERAEVVLEDARSPRGLSREKRALLFRVTPPERVAPFDERGARDHRRPGSDRTGPGERDGRDGERDRGTHDGPDRRGGARPPFPPPFRLPNELLHYVAGLASLRAGDPENAVLHLRPVAESPSLFPASRIVLPVLALAYSELGEGEAARSALDAASTTLDEWVSALEEGSVEDLPVLWIDLLECSILCREAHAMIDGASLSSDARLEEIEARAGATLRGE